MCQSCDLIYINGVACHEHGCPDAWADEIRECAWCGQEFQPGQRYQKCCSSECEEAYYGL